MNPPSVKMGCIPNQGAAPEAPMSTTIRARSGKVTVPDILSRKFSLAADVQQTSRSQESHRSEEGSTNKITCLTAYDYPTARLLDEAGVDILLVGDSLGMVVLGYDSTLPVTLDEMLHHTRAVRRGTHRALLVADMPFGTYQGDSAEAVRNAVRFVKEAGAEAVKVEGGERRMDLIARLVDAQIPVMGHIGLTPQSQHLLGGFKVQGKSVQAAEQLFRDAQAIAAAGAFSVVLESIPRELAALITERLPIPTIGIGGGPECDGEVVVVS